MAGTSAMVTSSSNNGRRKDLHYYKPLYKAVLQSNWEDAYEFISKDPDAVNAGITESGQTALHVAVGTKNESDFLKNLVNCMPKGSLGLTNRNGETALSVAAIVGNLRAVELLVGENPMLPYVWSKPGYSPLHRAAQYGWEDIVSRLLDDTHGHIGRSPYSDESGILLLLALTDSRLYGQAIQVLENNSSLLKMALRDYRKHKEFSPLVVLANQPSAFLSSLNCLQRRLYSCIPLETHGLCKIKRGDEENQLNNTCGQHGPMSFGPKTAGCFSWLGIVCRHLYAALWHFAAKKLSWFKHLKETKMSYYQAHQLFSCICKEVISLEDNNEIEDFLRSPLLTAATLGIEEIVLDIIKLHPSALWFKENGHGLFQLAVLHRQKHIFRIIYKIGGDIELVTKYIDQDGNNILHLAGNKASPDRLNLIPGVVFQMQYELKWFKKVKTLVKHSYKHMKNNKGQTPEMLFIKEHKELLDEAKEWIKGTANSCMTAATLITTIVFAAAITVPGGNDQNTGYPMFNEKTALFAFFIADASALFSSVVSILMFLAILSSRYYHTDFLHTLPRTLGIGLLALFFAITSVMVVFTLSIILVVGHEKSRIAKLAIIVIVSIFAVVSVLLFLWYQGGLVWTIISNTVIPGWLRKKKQKQKHTVY